MSNAARWILLLAAIRMILLWSDDPMLAVANNYDMIRVQACIDAYPDRAASIPPEANSYDSPIERYRFVRGVGAPCFFTSEALFAAIAWPAARLESHFGDGSFSVRWVGGVKLVLLLSAVFAVHRALRRSSSDAMLTAGHAALVLLVLSDPALSLYLNGFYAEFSAVFFAYILLAALAVCVARSSAGQHSMFWLMILSASAVLLAIAKVQHVLTPLLMLCVLLLLSAMRRGVPRRVLFALAIGSLVGGALQGWHLASDQTASMRRANTINTVFYAMLPRSTDPLSLTRSLGIDEACSALAGSNWFTPGMQEGALCPEALDLTRMDIVRALLQQPMLAPRVLIEGARRSRPWIPAYLGLVEGTSMGTLPPAHPSLGTVLDGLPMRLYLAAFGALPFVSLGFVLMRPRPSQRAGNAVLSILGFLPSLCLAIVVLGDGYADTAKQMHLGTTLALSCYVLLALIGVRIFTQRVGPVPVNS